MSKSLYFEKDSDMCYTIQAHFEAMKEQDIKQMTVFKAKVERGTGMFFCKAFGEVGEAGEGCGKECSEYNPRNGKSGICKHYGYVYEQTDKKLILKSCLIQTIEHI
jgi:hypothetical protein